MTDTALLIIDIQNDYFPGGAMELEGAGAAGAKAASALKQFRSQGLPIIHVRHLSTRPGSTFFLPGTKGAEIHAAVTPEKGETVVEKNFPNSFRATGLKEILEKQQVKNLVVAGMMTHMCVDATTRAAADLGFRCSLAHDACATRALSFGTTKVPAEHVHCSFLSALNGAYAAVQPARALVEATLHGDA